MSAKTTKILLVTVALFAFAGAALAVPTRTIPDGGSSGMLLTAACVGLAATRRFFGRGKQG